MNAIRKTVLIASISFILLSLILLIVEFQNQARPTSSQIPAVEANNFHQVEMNSEVDDLWLSQMHEPRIKASSIDRESSGTTKTAEADEEFGIYPKVIVETDQPDQATLTLSSNNLDGKAISLPAKSESDEVAEIDASISAANRLPSTPSEAAVSSPVSSDLGTLTISKISLDQEIVQVPNDGSGWNLADLEKDIALLGGTGRYPLDDKAMVFAGHYTTYWPFAGPFYDLDKLMPSDQITYVYRNQEFRYEISKLMYVDASQVGVIDRDNGEQIILLTCSDFQLKLGTYTQRLVVIADLVEIQPVSPNLGLSDENPIFDN